MATNQTEEQNSPRMKYSRPCLSKMITIQSENTIQIMDNLVNQTMSSLYTIEVILNFMGNETVTDEANETVSKFLKGKVKQFDDEIKSLKKKCDDLDVDVDDFNFSYSLPRSYDYKIYSPLCSTFLKLVLKYDQIVMLVDTLWVNDEMSRKARKDYFYKHQQHMRNISRRMINVSRQAYFAAKSTGNEKEVQEALQEVSLDKELTNSVINNQDFKLAGDDEAEAIAKAEAIEAEEQTA